MPRTTLFKAVLLLVLVLFLAAPSLQAAEPRRDAEPVRSVSSGLAAWEMLAQLWEFLTSAWDKNGCLIEPDGRCLPRQNPTAESENGCEVDPNGCQNR